MEQEAFRKALAESELVLVGIGEEWEKSPEGAEGYACLEKLLAGKNYFIVTTAADGKIRESGLPVDRIAEAGAAGEDGASAWDTYMKWLQGTLNKRLLILELGVGFRMPDAVRWPFERIAYLNRQAKLFRVHGKLPQLPENLEGKGVSIRENSIKWLKSF